MTPPNRNELPEGWVIHAHQNEDYGARFQASNANKTHATGWFRTSWACINQAWRIVDAEKEAKDGASN